MEVKMFSNEKEQLRFDTIQKAKNYFCAKFWSKAKNCYGCPLQNKDYLNCTVFCEKEPDKAARIMGFEPITLDTDSDKMTKTTWTKSELAYLIELLTEADKIVTRHEIIDKNDLYFVTSESRLRSALTEAINWANIINNVGENIED